METPLSLTLLYTAGIAGDITLLPRLFTYLQRLKPADSRRTLLLDLGGSCSQSVWHCRATAGRSILIVLDGMGYHAANVDGILDTATRDKLAEQVSVALVDRNNKWRYSLSPLAAGQVFATLSPVGRAARLQILLDPADSTRLEDNTLRLQAACAGQIGQVSINLGLEPRIVSARIHTMPGDTPPNPSIAGAVEFVLSEARLFQRKQRGETP